MEFATLKTLSTPVAFPVFRTVKLRSTTTSILLGDWACHERPWTVLGVHRQVGDFDLGCRGNSGQCMKNWMRQLPATSPSSRQRLRGRNHPRYFDNHLEREVD